MSKPAIRGDSLWDGEGVWSLGFLVAGAGAADIVDSSLAQFKERIMRHLSFVVFVGSWVPGWSGRRVADLDSGVKLRDCLSAPRCLRTVG